MEQNKRLFSGKESAEQMLSENKIERINELAKKARSEGLTQSEKDEQILLRAAYLESFREQFRAVLKEEE